jgi:hypothetical protein
MIDVHPVDSSTFEVTVQGPTTTKHTVTLSPQDYQTLTGGRVAPEVLVRKSFEFLLERESNTSILRRFDLPVIAQYFPEYRRTIRAMHGLS